MKEQRTYALLLAVFAAVSLFGYARYEKWMEPEPVKNGWIFAAVSGSDEDKPLAINDYTGQERVLWNGVRVDEYGIVCCGKYVYFGGFETELDRLTALWRCSMVSGEVQHISDCVYSWCIDSGRLYYSYKEKPESQAVVRECRLNGEVIRGFVVDDTVSGDGFFETLEFEGNICGVSGKKMVYTKSARGTDALPYIFVMDMEYGEEICLEQGMVLAVTDDGFAASNSLEWGMRFYSFEDLAFQTCLLKGRSEMMYCSGKWFSRVIESRERWYMSNEPYSLGRVLFEKEYVPGGTTTLLYPGKEHAVVVTTDTGCWELVSYDSGR